MPTITDMIDYIIMLRQEILQKNQQIQILQKELETNKKEKESKKD
jgi:hypothetical protein